MSASRARTRLAVLAVAVPLVAGGALVSPAFAATASVTPYATIGSDNTVGPNAGFRNPAQGVRGSTAVFKADVSSASASLDRVDLRLSGYSDGPAIVPSRDFAQGDGFAVFKDVSAGPNNTLGGPDGTFDATDFAQGPVSTGYQLFSPTSGYIPVRVLIDGVRATNSTRYFVTVHPADTAGQTENRAFKLTLPVDGIRFGDATTSPAAAVETPRLTIDSKYPIPPVGTNFTPSQQPPFERQGATKVEDAYIVSNAENNDPDKTLVFLNDGNNTADSNFLYRTSGAPAIEGVPAVTKPIFIGDGTGITATSKVARNNQVSDDVFVRAFDTLGNLTPAVRLFDNSAATSGDNVNRSNDVTAPKVTATAAALKDGVRGINVANEAAVPVKVTYTIEGTTARAAVTTVESRVVVTHGGVLSTDPSEASPWGSLAVGNSATSAEVPTNSTGVGTTGSQMRLQARVYDAAKNTSDLWNSANLFPKDITPPTLTGVSFENDQNTQGTGQPGDTIRVQWSEPMYKASIGESAQNNTVCVPPSNSSCVNSALIFPDGGIDWGVNPTVVWSADLTSILVTLGQPQPGPNANRLPAVNDKVRSTASVQDPVGNAATIPSMSDRFIAGTPPIPNLVTTKDNGGRNLYNQGRDGYLDQVIVTFPVVVSNLGTNLTSNLPNFKIVGSDVVTPTSGAKINDTSFSLNFGGVIGSGETPLVEYTPPASGGLVSGAVAVPKFSVRAQDTAPPALRLLTTADTDNNGQLDTLVARYSEAIDHDTNPLNGAEYDGIYTVPGYEDQPDGALGCPASGGVVDPWNSSTEGDTADVTNIVLCELDAPDTAVTPGASAADGLTDVSTAEAGTNTGGTGWGTGNNDTTSVFNRVLDKAPPVAVSRTTRDLNADGRIDAIDIVYGEALDAFSIENARYSVANRSVTSIDILGTNGVRLNLAPIAPGATGDTDSKPTVQYTGGPNGGLTDASDQRNSVRPDAAPAATTDGAGPAIMAACAGTASNNGTCPVDTATDDKIKVFLSEAVTAADVAAGDFIVEQPAGTNKAVTAVAYTAADKFVTLTLANNAINPATDALVRFSAANVVGDTATPKNGNTQTAAVTAPAPPAVSLNLTCPVAATTGYCGAAFVNTGAVSTAGLVRTWRLATTARTGTTPDSEYSPNQPAIYPPAGSPALPEGLLTLYLTGKDDFGRLSTEVTKSIQILKAPFIQNVSFLNTTTVSATDPHPKWARTDTVVDGDSVRVGGTVFSTDVGSWGTCPSNAATSHMSVDYRSITGNSTQGTVGAFTCNLNTATAPDSRSMVFPFVKASGTTHFPVGTVIKLTANDPGALIVDGPNGTQLRRHFISVNARRSHQIPDSSVITVPVSVMNGIKKGSGMGYRDGAIIKTSTSGFYYLYQNIKRPVSGATLAAWKIPTTQVYVVSPAEFNAHGTGVGLKAGSHAVGTWVKFANGSISQLVRNAQGVVVRRGVSNASALKTLVPSGQIYTANSQDAAIPFDTTWLKGYRDGTLVKTGTNTYGVVARGVLRPFADIKTFNTMGYNAANAVTFSSSAMPRPYTGSYLTGSSIGRYLIPTLVIKATNNAGGTALAKVLPNGIFGVGNLDPVPNGWDFTR